MKALWSAASGMKNLQLKIDTISNNLSNVNTTGFKGQRLEFKDIMYDQMVQKEQIQNEGSPVPLEIGHGVMSAATLRDFTTGNLQQTDNQFDIAISGDHFFNVVNENGELRYTKDGSFKVASTDEGMKLVTTEGFYVQNADGADIVLGNNVKEFMVDSVGNMKVKRAGEEEYENIGTIGLSKFVNPAGLEAEGKNLYKATKASGTPINGIEDIDDTEVMQGFLEGSNVEIVDEMINLITAERAYEINSKSIQTADRLLEIANNIKR